ncbi:MAG: tetratricopeptide repeat protein, partial [Ekhidna sp.]
MRQLIFLLSLTISISSFAQSRQAEYLEAKSQFNLGNYDAAKQAFSSLSEDQFFGSYSSFYFALSSFKQGDAKQATDMWKQILMKSPNWDQNGEVHYWLANSYLVQKKYYEAFQYADKLSEENRSELLDAHFQKKSNAALSEAYALNPNNATIATYLAKSIAKQPYEKRDHQLLAELSEKFGVPINGNDLDLPLIKKETYSVGVVLPFMFESLEDPQSVLRNTIIFDLYQGMQLAKQDLESKNISIELFPFDTKKSGKETKGIIKNESLKSADVIIGPLYPAPNKEISLFSMENEIAMVNPLSSNSSLIGNNSFSYLMKPSYETQGRMAANFASSTFTKNKKVLIFYETERDSLVAEAYKNTIQRDSF